MLESILGTIHLIVAVLLIVSILFQQRGSGIGGAFGGGSEVFYSKRGPEKIVFNISVGLAILFIALGLVQLIL